jgi:hypothetical protein
LGEAGVAIDPSKVCLYVPDNLKKFKLDLFERIAGNIEAAGGMVIRHRPQDLDDLPRDIIPIIGCHPECTALIEKWNAEKRDLIYWDRGYAMRWFATCLPQPKSMERSFYRWHLNSFQMTSVRQVADDRWKALETEVQPWARGGRHIVIAAPTKTYARFHRCESWIADTIAALAKVTDRQLVIRDKEQYKRRPIQRDIAGAHCLVTHGSNAAVESVILGCPVFVHPSSAAALVGRTDLNLIERPTYPERGPWLSSLAYSQFDERELVDGTLWRLIN